MNLIKLIDGSVYQVSRSEVVNGQLEIDFKDRSAEEVQEIFSTPANLANIEILTTDGEKYGDVIGYSVYSSVMLVGETKTVILTHQTDPVQERLTNVEAKALEAKTIAEEMKENGIPFERNAVLNASVMVARANAQSLSDNEALEAKAIYNTWEELVYKGFIAADSGYKFTYENNLYKTVHENQRFLAEWVPGSGTEGIFTRIDEVHAGTLEDPIPAAANMEYVKGLYYSEDEKLYLMNREGMAAGESIVLQFMPSALVGQYFEAVL